LLRRTPESQKGSSDQCARFAWAPDATRIELVNPDDLTGQIVRRRAYFLWMDTIRNLGKRTPKYAIQKITASGSTHFPDWELDGAP
jgi:hypothetical protein